MFSDAFRKGVSGMFGEGHGGPCGQNEVMGGLVGRWERVGGDEQ